MVISTFPLIFAAPSGAGKTAIVQALTQHRDDLEFSVSLTTRPRRAYERDGEHYHFVDEPEFRRLIDEGQLLEWAEVHGNMYGTPRRNLDLAQELNRFLVLDIDIQGARQLRESVPDAVSIFVLPPSGTELARRLAHRGSEVDSVQRRRLQNARAELQAAGEFKYIVVNDSLSSAVEQVIAILRAESCSSSRVLGLEQTIARIGAEIDEELGHQ